MKKIFLGFSLMLPLFLNAQGVTKRSFRELNTVYQMAEKVMKNTTTESELAASVAIIDSLSKVTTANHELQQALKLTAENCPLKYSDAFVHSLCLQADMREAYNKISKREMMQNKLAEQQVLSTFLKSVELKESTSFERKGNEGAPFETKAQRDKRIKWWRDGKFGMFIHYGLYSGLAGEFQGKQYDGQAEWIQIHSGADFETYKKETLPKFNPKPGNPTAWVKMAKDAGCTYVVLTSRHHEGFSLYNNRHSDFDVVDLNGYDLIQEYADACDRYKVKAGYYVSLLDWNHPDFDPRPGEIPYPKGNYQAAERGERHFGNHEKYKEYLYNIVDDLLSQHRVDLIWWDYSFPKFEGDEAWGATRLMHRIFKANPNIIQNNRLFCLKNHAAERKSWVTPRWKGDFSTPEQYIPATGIDGDWETCQTLNGTWGYSAFNQNWKTEKQLIRELIDVVSRGGNYLLNIGPMPDGSIPKETLRLFKEIGKWMKVNGDAIYGTSANPFNEEFKWGRVTRKGDRTLFLHVYEKPEDGKIVIPCAFEGKVSVSLLRDGKKVKVEETPKGCIIDLTDVEMSPHATVLKMKGKWRVK